MPKPWSVSATLRGFYDDNFNTVPNNSTTTRQSLLALKSSPAIALQWPPPKTHASLGYLYSLSITTNRPAGNSDKYEPTHSLSRPRARLLRALPTRGR